MFANQGNRRLTHNLKQLLPCKSITATRRDTSMESLRDVMRCGSSLRHHEPGSINKRPGKNQRCEPVKRQLPCFIHAAPRYLQGTGLIASSFQLHCRLAAKTADDQTVQACTFTLMMQARPNKLRIYSSLDQGLFHCPQQRKNWTE